MKYIPTTSAIIGRTISSVVFAGCHHVCPILRKAPEFSTLVKVKWLDITEIFSLGEISFLTMVLVSWSQLILADIKDMPIRIPTHLLNFIPIRLL